MLERKRWGAVGMGALQWPSSHLQESDSLLPNRTGFLFSVSSNLLDIRVFLANK